MEMQAKGGSGLVRYSQMEDKMASPTLWAQHGTYPPRQGNEIRILIDGQAAYSEVAAAFHSAKKFIYLTISYGDQDFLLVPESGETHVRYFEVSPKGRGRCPYGSMAARAANSGHDSRSFPGQDCRRQ